VNFIANTKNKRNDEVYTRNSYPIISHEEPNRSYNIFESLSDVVELYKCNNFGHMDKYRRLIVPPREPKKNINSHKKEPQRIWIGKHHQFNTEECNISLQDQQKKMLMVC